MPELERTRTDFKLEADSTPGMGIGPTFLTPCRLTWTSSCAETSPTATFRSFQKFPEYARLRLRWNLWNWIFWSAFAVLFNPAKKVSVAETSNWNYFNIARNCLSDKRVKVTKSDQSDHGIQNDQSWIKLLVSIYFCLETVLTFFYSFLFPNVCVWVVWPRLCGPRGQPGYQSAVRNYFKICFSQPGFKNFVFRFFSILLFFTVHLSSLAHIFCLSMFNCLDLFFYFLFRFFCTFVHFLFCSFAFYIFCIFVCFFVYFLRDISQ